jgi:hypothetical protein
MPPRLVILDSISPKVLETLKFFSQPKNYRQAAGLDPPRSENPIGRLVLQVVYVVEFLRAESVGYLSVLREFVTGDSTWLAGKLIYL